MKKLMGFGIGASMLFVMAMPALAKTPTSGLNLNVMGNTVRKTVNVSTVNVTTNNTAFVTNNVTSIVNTGGNDASFNLGKVDMKTGNANVLVNISNDLNRSVVVVK